MSGRSFQARIRESRSEDKSNESTLTTPFRVDGLGHLYKDQKGMNLRNTVTGGNW